MSVTRLVAAALMCAATATPVSADVTLQFKGHGQVFGGETGDATEHRKGLKSAEPYPASPLSTFPRSCERIDGLTGGTLSFENNWESCFGSYTVAVLLKCHSMIIWPLLRSMIVVTELPLALESVRQPTDPTTSPAVA